MNARQSAESDAPFGCHPMLVCTDRPELCPPACQPVVRNAGEDTPPDPGCAACGRTRYRDTALCEECYSDSGMPYTSVTPSAMTDGQLTPDA